MLSWFPINSPVYSTEARLRIVSIELNENRCIQMDKLPSPNIYPKNGVDRTALFKYIFILFL